MRGERIAARPARLVPGARSVLLDLGPVSVEDEQSGAGPWGPLRRAAPLANTLPAEEGGLRRPMRGPMAIWRARHRLLRVCASPPRARAGRPRHALPEVRARQLSRVSTPPSSCSSPTVIVRSLGRQASWPPGRYSTDCRLRRAGREPSKTPWSAKCWKKPAVRVRGRELSLLAAVALPVLFDGRLPCDRRLQRSPVHV